MQAFSAFFIKPLHSIFTKAVSILAKPFAYSATLNLVFVFSD
ncbi:hypothetical protein B4096_0188 [Heyndrickxia coagulans]|nr:hypothetical protein B4096_0188 [Heyndrickxia coagulans]